MLRIISKVYLFVTVFHNGNHFISGFTRISKKGNAWLFSKRRKRLLFKTMTLQDILVGIKALKPSTGFTKAKNLKAWKQNRKIKD